MKEARLVPRAEVTGSLVGELRPEFLRELDGLLANIEVQFGATARRVLGFTGAVTGEGATTVALHFAYLLARTSGKRILLVDSDVGAKKVSLSSPLGVRPGLVEVLCAEARLEEVVLATEVSDLHFLPAGAHGPHADAMKISNLQSLGDRLGKLYDWVILDLAPVLEHPESRLLASVSDGVVLVVRAHRTPRATAQRALDLLTSGRCRVLGTVLNARKESLPGFLRERV
ncbi:MAG: CpsD/CapB family tyrosine-protein kinase [Candidatus Eisenbacteria bacterium]